jgi:hypothetical protein
MPIITNTGTVTATTTVLFQLTGQGAGKGDGVIAYLSFDAGNDTTVTVSELVKQTSLDDTYVIQEIVSGALATVEFVLAEGLSRLVIPSAKSEDWVGLEFTGLSTGTVSVEFIADQYYN